jgi:hypothetical protein
MFYIYEILKNIPNEIYVIDKKYNRLEIPNSSTSDYNLFFGNLIQSRSGTNVRISADDQLKGIGYNPKLVIDKNEVNFYDAKKNLYIKF